MIKIVIIEDDPTISQMYRIKFESDGFEVHLAANGQIGINVAEKVRPDIILLDLQMPEMDGTEALKIIRSRDWGKTVPVIILTLAKKKRRTSCGVWVLIATLSKQTTRRAKLSSKSNQP